MFLSEGVLLRPYVQYEIREAIKLKKKLVLVHEPKGSGKSAFDFESERDTAPPDLQELLDNHESLAFRRRGYERDALLQAVIKRGGFEKLYDKPDGKEDVGLLGADEAAKRRKPESNNKVNNGQLAAAAAGLAACACTAYAYSSRMSKGTSGKGVERRAQLAENRSRHCRAVCLRHMVLLNQGFGRPGVREEKIALHAPEVTKSTRKSIVRMSGEEHVDSIERLYKGYDPTRGELYATDASGAIRVEIEEAVPGKVFRVTAVAGPEMIRLNPSSKGAIPYLTRVDVTFNEDMQIESLFTATHIPGVSLPSETAFLPAHLQNKTLSELAYHIFALWNRIHEPGTKEEWVAMHAPELTVSSITNVHSFGADSYYDSVDTTYRGYDPARGGLWATNEDGTLRADIEEPVPGKLVRITALAGPEMIRCIRFAFFASAWR